MKNVNFSLSDSFELVGLWWLPECPDNQVPGQLSFSGNETIQLKLIGSFDRLDDEHYQSDIILGITLEGHYVTILDNMVLGTSRSYPGVDSQIIYAQYLLVGHHFQTKDEILFHSFGISYEYLEEWYGETLFKTALLKDGEFFQGYNISLTRPKPTDFLLSSYGGVLRIAFAIGNIGDKNQSLTINNEAYLFFEPPLPKDIPWYQRFFFDIERFLTLMVGEITFPRRIQGFLNVELNEKTIPKRIDIFRVQDRRTKRDLYKWEMLFTYPKLSLSMPQLLEKWLQNIDVARPAYDLFFGYLFRSNMFLEFKFLALIQALESFHRATNLGKYMSDEDYGDYKNQMVENIPSGISGGWRDSLKNRLKYGNEYSLSKRLKELFEDLDDGLKSLVSIKQSRFIADIVNTRNYFTHYDSSLKEKCLDSQGIVLACKQMKVLMTILLLRQIQIDDKTIHEAILKNRKLRLVN